MYFFDFFEKVFFVDSILHGLDNLLSKLKSLKITEKLRKLHNFDYIKRSISKRLIKKYTDIVNSQVVATLRISLANGGHLLQLTNSHILKANENI